MVPAENLEIARKIKVSYLDMVRFARAVLRALKLPKVSDTRQAGRNNVGMLLRLVDETLIPQSINIFWSELSERVVLNTWAATLGFSKDGKDKLGRWWPEQSDDYL
eukprot:5661501-Karenia_brevis.AAC.1